MEKEKKTFKMKYLGVNIQNRFGRALKEVKNVGFVSVLFRTPGNRIIIDDFTGAGDTYRKLEFTHIRVYENDEQIFVGTEESLIEILKNYQRNAKA